MFTIAKIGKCVGLKGELKLHLLTDFPEQFKKGSTFKSDKLDLTIEYYNEKRGTVKFVGYDDRNMAEKLTTRSLYATEEETRENCNLSEDEYYYFDIIGCNIIENDKTLGEITDILDINGTNYFEIKTNASMIESGYAKNFMVPYIDKYVQSIDIDQKAVITQDAKLILENS
jgi:16S rRNA processing protein RimM